MKRLFVIPARLESTRMEKKLLRKLDFGMNILENIVTRALDATYLAFEDDTDLVLAVDNYEELVGGSVVLRQLADTGQIKVRTTSKDHIDGTSRAQEIVRRKEFKDYDRVFIIQADELDVRFDDLIALDNLLNTGHIATMGQVNADIKDLKNRNVVKVESNGNHSINLTRDSKENFPFIEHIGLYAWQTDALRYTKQESALAKEHNIELLKAVEANLIIRLHVTENTYININTEEDMKKALQ